MLYCTTPIKAEDKIIALLDQNARNCIQKSPCTQEHACNTHIHSSVPSVIAAMSDCMTALCLWLELHHLHKIMHYDCIMTCINILQH